MLEKLPPKMPLLVGIRDRHHFNTLLRESPSNTAIATGFRTDTSEPTSVSRVDTDAASVHLERCSARE
jgi:hypothetical protein